MPTKPKEESFLLREAFAAPLNQAELKDHTRTYHEYLNDYPVNELKHTTTYAFIKALKRSKHRIGPYQNLTLFEAMNRIFSDLTILKGAREIFEDSTLIGEEKPVQSIRLNLSNIGGFDLEITTHSGVTVIGEGFNAAESFFTIKMGSVCRKLMKALNKTDKGYDKAVVVFNADALEDPNGKNRTYLKGKKARLAKDNYNITFIACPLEDWHL